MRIPLCGSAALLASLLSACFPPACAGVNRTPGNREVVIWEPAVFELATAFSNQYNFLQDCGYRLHPFIQYDGSDPSVNLSNFVQSISNPHGILLHSGHGAQDSGGSILVETFQGPSGEGNRDAAYTGYTTGQNPLFTTDQIAKVTVQYRDDNGILQTYYGIQITSAGLSRYSHDYTTLRWLSDSYSSAVEASFPFPHAGTNLYYTFSPSVASARYDIAQIFSSMSGFSNMARRSLESALVDHPDVPLHTHGPTTVVLMPAVSSVQPPDGSYVAAAQAANVVFDTVMDTGISPKTFMADNGFSVRIDQSVPPVWHTTAEIRYTLLPQEPKEQTQILINPSEYAPDPCSVDCYTAGAQSLGGIPLFNPQFGKAYTVPITYTTVGAAGEEAFVRWISAVPEAGGNRIRFETHWESQSDSFVVDRIAPDGTPGIRVGSLQAHCPSGCVYEILDLGGLTGQAYGMYEIEVSGEGRQCATVIAQPAPAPPAPEFFDPDSLQSVVYSLDDPNIEPVAPRPDPGAYVLVCPDFLATSLQAYADQWTPLGVSTTIFRLSDLQSGETLRDYIRWAASRGTKFVLLVGDANEYQWSTDPARWAFPGWDIANSGVAQPWRDLIPTFYFADPDPPDINMSVLTPYYASDLPYADIDDDGLPDIAVGRLPVDDLLDLNAYIAKLHSYLHTGIIVNVPPKVAILASSGNGDGPGAVHTERVDAFASIFPVSGSGAWNKIRWEAKAPPTTDPWNWKDPASWVWANPVDGDSAIRVTALQFYPNHVFWFAAGSGPYNWALGGSDYVNAAMRFPAFDQTQKPIVSFAATCSQACFDMNEWPHPIYGYPMRVPCKELLFNPTRGAIVHIGPTRGSWQAGNFILADEYASLVVNHTRPYGYAFMVAQRACMVRHPALAQLFRSYVFLGDPVVGSSVGTITGVEEGTGAIQSAVGQPTPNPSNPGTSFSLTIGASSGLWNILVFDVNGRRVRTLAHNQHLTAGTRVIRWDGKTDNGTRVGSGIYFVRFQWDEGSTVRKVALAK